MTKPNQTIVFAVRHGETEWNRVNRIQGHLDSPLTAVGRQQAQALAVGLKDCGLQHIYSSDLGRAMRTAEVIGAELGLTVKSDERLRERHLGAMQGMTKEEFFASHPAVAATYDFGDPDFSVPGGESVRERHDRCIAGCADLVSRHPGEKLLLVVHGGVLRSLFHHTQQLPLNAPRRFSLFNAAINVFSITGGVWRLETWGSTAHLPGLNPLDDN